MINTISEREPTKKRKKHKGIKDRKNVLLMNKDFIRPDKYRTNMNIIQMHTVHQDLEVIKEKTSLNILCLVQNQLGN